MKNKMVARILNYDLGLPSYGDLKLKFLAPTSGYSLRSLRSLVQTASQIVGARRLGLPQSILKNLAVQKSQGILRLAGRFG